MSQAKNPFEKNPLGKGKAEQEETDTSVGTGEEETPETSPETVPETEKETSVSEDKKAASTPKPKKATPTQQLKDALQRVEELEAQMARKADATDVKVFRDEVLSEDGVGGQTRLVSDGRTLVNADWRLTKDGLRVLVGRSSMQAQTHFQVPASLLESLHELLGHYSHIADK